MNFATKFLDFLSIKKSKNDNDTCYIKKKGFYTYCCGIVGYLGNEDTNEILLHGINAMKSRGYDSCGVCTLHKGKLKVTKCCSVETPADSFNILKDKVLSSHPPSTVGIGHTRWATVGKLSNKNSHPHIDLAKNIALVHNGTISNIEDLYHDYYAELISQKNKFSFGGSKYHSINKNIGNSANSTPTTKESSDETQQNAFQLPDSDSESVAIFVGLEYENTGDLLLAFKNTIKKLKGTWALCMMSQHYPNSLFVAAHEAPLLVARSERGVYVGSEPNVFMKYVKDCIVLNDGDILELSLENVESYYSQYNLLKLESEVVEETCEPYPNWYTKEILEQIYIGRIIISLLSEQSNFLYQFSFDDMAPIGNQQNQNQVMNEEANELLSLRDKYLGNDNLCVIEGDPNHDNSLLSKVDISTFGFDFPNLPQDILIRLKKTKKLLFVACGSSLHAATYVAKILQKIHHFDLVEVDDASDLTLYRYHDKDVTVVHISNSGETLDCILALNFIKRINPDCLSISIINTVHTSLERSSDATIHLRIGREKSVPSTKAFTAQVTVLLIFSLYIISNNEIILDPLDDSTDYCSSVDKDEPSEYLELTNKDFSEQLTTDEDEDETYNEHYGSCHNYTIASLYKSLSIFPSAIAKLLKNDEQYDSLAQWLLKEKIVYILGRGCGHVVALEASLKMKEVAYIQAEGVLSGAMKHGIYAMIKEEENTTTISIITSEDKEMTINSTLQIKARGGYIIVITDLEDEVDFADVLIRIPSIGALTPALAIIPIQIITSKIAILSNRNPDIPRGLAKTVTTL
ncbi:glucosamine--fructose-6-phosphate aminotransferase, putative [Theileria annulata]|uniref:glutamine--fructose-6-phosphate transaminase (isomerizing) n=1 Tax=Theileria annulata TaxID=5874 RepID=Q4UFR7_THEAN|nr:glucosamine--fructose-6-phosphate aminotransferase, putative [Theileria annulata]CAI74049.1 glucosamine--fructose-6-phosphate aminotransferase, putative [Theileria annulata]|eukprot:XP_951781.1 glucosamine--fructose-6-phosphate aminotransferase, putative [Theileria annulata]